MVGHLLGGLTQNQLMTHYCGNLVRNVERGSVFTKQNLENNSQEDTRLAAEVNGLVTGETQTLYV